MKLRILNCDGIARVRPLAAEGNAAGDPGPQQDEGRGPEGPRGHETLEHLYFEGTTISDLSPLKGMRLTTLTVCTNPVSDLSPLKGMKLTFLHCGGTKVSDLSPLNGMPLTHLNCAGTKVTDASLAQIKGCKDLTSLPGDTQVSDAGLAHLKDHQEPEAALSGQGPGCPTCRR